MNYAAEFRDRDRAHALLRAIEAEARADRAYHIMEFCGGHTHTIFRYGIQQLLPPPIRLLHGPGCPVCVLPAARVAQAVDLALQPGIVLCCYGDVIRVPAGRNDSLLEARARGADVRIVYSAEDALKIARQHPDRHVIFFGLGFETTTPPSAVVVRQAAAEGLDNFSVFSNHVLTPSAISHLLQAPEVRGYGAARVDAFLGPGHVSAVIGSRPYEYFAEEFQRPVVIAGFEPIDILQSLWMLVRQLNDGRAAVENQYTRVVTRDGNRAAQAVVADVFELRKEFEWRGLGMVPYSGLRIKQKYARWDAEARFPIEVRTVAEIKGCECGAVLRGVKTPLDCRLFGRACTPETPRGSCMVSGEGACAAYYTHRHAAS